MANKKIYISGAITSDPEYKDKFARAEKMLTDQGHVAINPARLPAGLDYEDYMYIHLATIHICDTIYMLPDWESSPGAKREKHFAETLGKKVMFGK